MSIKIPTNLLHRLDENQIKVAGLNVKCIPSNVRVRNIKWDSMKLSSGIGKEGNLVVVEAISDSGSVTTIENQDGVFQRIYKGDRFVAVLANRFSGTSELGGVPQKGIRINNGLKLQLLSRAGIVGVLEALPPAKIHQGPFNVKVLGLLFKNSKPVDLIELCGGLHDDLEKSAPVVLICGTSAEVGKTTTSVSLIRALKLEGLKVGGVKISGSGGMAETFNYRDAGAFPWLDTEDVGIPTTYTTPERFTKAIYTTFNYLNSKNPDIIVGETGGDPIESNIPSFLSDNKLMQYVKAIVVVSSDVLGIMGIVTYLRKFAPDIDIFLADPKDRNQLSTRNRVKEQLPELIMFNSINISEVQKVVQKIIKKI